ncbi:hypothetical protein PVK06_039549 [Gossypium arboreum]|uniref:Secreted protein n=1 Tax=Gossypium arboreum TaxID=29729 RepID=A0ABR0N3W9_GOSAR|nr:hypothetical protein PVK06_039549 [Gossypium arboreum]
MVRWCRPKGKPLWCPVLVLRVLAMIIVIFTRNIVHSIHRRTLGYAKHTRKIVCPKGLPKRVQEVDVLGGGRGALVVAYVEGLASISHQMNTVSHS